MNAFVVVRVMFHGFELGLEVTQSLSAAVGTTTLVGELEVQVLNFVTAATPADIGISTIDTQGVDRRLLSGGE